MRSQSTSVGLSDQPCNQPIPEKAAALRHVELVTGSQDAAIYLRFLDDTRSGRDAAERCGTIKNLWPEIVDFQRQRYGVFLIPNATARAGDFVRDEDVTDIRVCFADADGIGQPVDWHVQPAFIVRRDAMHWHPYWIVNDVPVLEFERLQRRLAAHYGTDPKVCNPSRVMRLAGSLHWKDPSDPRLVALEDRTENRDRWEITHTLADMRADLPDVKAPAAVVVAPEGVALDTPNAITRARTLLTDLVKRGDVAVEFRGGNNRTYQLACELLNLGLSPDAARELLGEIWNPACRPPWSDAQLIDIVDHAARYAQNEAGAWAVPPAAEAFPDAAKFAASDATDSEDDGAPQRIEGEDENEDFDDWPVSAADYQAREFKPVAELVPGWIEKGIVTYLEGPGGTHKSRTGLQDSLCLAAGVEIFGEPSTKTGCLYLNYENPPDEMARRIHQMCRGLKRTNADPDLDVSGVAIWELRDKPRPMLLVKKDGEIRITRFGRRVLKYLADRRDSGRHTFVVFDGLMDAIVFEGGTRNEDAVAIRIIKLLDRWCVEYDFTSYAIIHPSRAAERQGISGGSYATAWTTKPRSIQAMAKVKLKPGEPITDQTYERKVIKRSHGKDGAAIVLQYRNGCILPVVFKSNASPVTAAASVLLWWTYGTVDAGRIINADPEQRTTIEAAHPDRLRSDGKLGSGRTAPRITNEHVLIEEFRRRTGNDRLKVNDFLGAAAEARKAGLLGYQEAPSGSHGKRDGARPAGYCAPEPLDVLSAPEGYADDPTEPAEDAG